MEIFICHSRFIGSPSRSIATNPRYQLFTVFRPYYGYCSAIYAQRSLQIGKHTQKYFMELFNLHQLTFSHVSSANMFSKYKMTFCAKQSPKTTHKKKCQTFYHIHIHDLETGFWIVKMYTKNIIRFVQFMWIWKKKHTNAFLPCVSSPRSNACLIDNKIKTVNKHI